MKSGWLTLVIILAVVAIGVVLITPRNNPSAGISEDVAKCIGQNSLIYVQFGCHACETQEKMFGENYKFLNIIDCWFEPEKCGGVERTPTWKIGEQSYTGVQSIKTLQQLTGC